MIYDVNKPKLSVEYRSTVIKNIVGLNIASSNRSAKNCGTCQTKRMNCRKYSGFSKIL